MQHKKMHFFSINQDKNPSNVLITIFLAILKPCFTIARKTERSVNLGKTRFDWLR